MLSAELLIVEILRQDDSNHPREKRRVLARTDLQMKMRQLGELGLSRVHHDELQAALDRLPNRM